MFKTTGNQGSVGCRHYLFTLGKPTVVVDVLTDDKIRFLSPRRGHGLVA